MKKLAIMQPYFYPYIGYFDLIKNVDVFVFLTDVQFTRRSWMTRNRIRSIQKDWQYIRINASKAPQKTMIFDIKINDTWLHALNSTLLNTYGKKIKNHPIFLDLQEYKNESNLCNILCKSIISIAKYFKLPTKFLDSRNYRSIHEKNQNGIIEITKNLGGEVYINPYGGKKLYQEHEFAKHNIKLEFMPKPQYVNELSILDLIFGEGIDSL
jgi:hypothetical protein